MTPQRGEGYAKPSDWRHIGGWGDLCYRHMTLLLYFNNMITNELHICHYYLVKQHVNGRIDYFKALPYGRW